VTINSSSAQRWGFQASPRLASDASSRGAGTLVRINDNTQLLPPRETIQWITHTAAGTRRGTSGPVSFEFDWTAPAEASGDVNFYVAANAANNNGINTGDQIYTASATLTPAAAQTPLPVISQSGVVNAASFASGIAAGSWVAIRGTNLAPTTRVWAQADFQGDRLPMSLDGVSVTVNGRSAPVYFISPEQLNVLSPADDSTGPVSVMVKTSAGESAPVSATLARFAPALFPFEPQNRRFAAAVSLDGTYVAPSGLFGNAATSRPARPGELIQLFGTGFGPTDPSVPVDRIFSGAAPLSTRVDVAIGGAAATVQFAGTSSNGLNQFNVTVPQSLSAGEHDVVLTIGGVSTPALKLAVAP
jgi:uncharacterized protein (TIGR03437 family)